MHFHSIIHLSMTFKTYLDDYNFNEFCCGKEKLGMTSSSFTALSINTVIPLESFAMFATLYLTFPSHSLSVSLPHSPGPGGGGGGVSTRLLHSSVEEIVTASLPHINQAT